MGADIPRISPLCFGESASCQRLRKQRRALCDSLTPTEWHLPDGSLPSHSTFVAATLVPTSRIKSGAHMVSQSDVGHHAWTCSWGRHTGYCPKLCQLWGLPHSKAASAVARMAWPHHKKIQMTTHTEGQISNRFLWQAYVLFVGNHFPEFSRMFMKLSEY